MKKPLTIASVPFGALAIFVAVSAQTQPQVSKPKALVGGTLIDGQRQPLRDSVVLIRGDRIEAVGTVDSVAVPREYERISTEGLTVLPGLWEFHTHLQYIGHPDYRRWRNEHRAEYEQVIMPATAGQLLMAGVTSARDLGAPPEAVIAVRERIRRGDLVGPTMYVAGPQLTATSSPETQDYRWGVRDANEAVLTVRQLASKGVNVIKVTDLDRMSLDTARAIVDAAHAQGLKVAAHGRSSGEILRGLAAGVDEFEHIDPRDEYSADVLAAIGDRTATGRLYWTPTVGTLIHSEYVRDHPDALDDPSWRRGLPQPIVEDAQQALTAFFRPPSSDARRRPALDVARLKRKFGQLRDAGVELLMGADIGTAAYFHSEGTWRELDAWVNRLGVDPMEAIRRATYWPALVMGVDRDYGTVSKGKYADVIAVRGDPLARIDVLRNPAIVIKHGRQYR